MTQSERYEIYVILWELGRLYSKIPHCEMCGKDCKVPKKGFVIHHFKYLKNEKTYNDFKSPGKKNLTTAQRLAYYRYLAPIVKRHKSRFGFLDIGCHTSLENAVRYGDHKWNNLCKLRAKTKRMQKSVWHKVRKIPA